MKQGLIVAAGTPCSRELLMQLAERSDLVAACDGGWRHCENAGICPDWLIGDMDSLGVSVPEREGLRVVQLPVEKDDTDTIFAMRRLAEAGCTDVTLCCALGGRLDHTFANLQALLFLQTLGVSGHIVDDNCCAEALRPGEYRILREHYTMFSLFSFGDVCENVEVENAKYPLHGYQMRDSFPIGVSNAFLGEEAVVRFSAGRMLLIRCRE